ncbi:MAG TPA: hypothetical protein VD997_15620 [Phycisphaerales bacterium]|nr:hypothetical protein [Phycisphaerales bacterium]
MSKLSVWAVLVAVVMMSFTLGGCSTPTLKVANVTFTPEQSLRDPNGKLPLVEVAVIGVSENDAREWNEYKVDSFFAGNDPRRAAAKPFTKDLVFTNDDAAAKTIAANDPIWQVWKERGATRLFIFANSKNLRSGEGGLELRRKELPFTSDRWKTNQIDIAVTSGGIDVRTKMEPLKK